MLNEFYDVVVVGGRVAGASLAAHVAQRGMSACVLERAEFPSDTMSTHLFHRGPALERLGVLDQLLATGAPLLTDYHLQMEDIDLSQTHPDLAMLSVRRRLLDPIVLARAVELGADAATRTRVIGLLSNGSRVTGVRVRDDQRREFEIRSRIVVGADGRTSTVARLVGARRYNVTDGQRCGACAYYRGVEPSPVVHFLGQGSDIFISYGTDSGLHLAVALWDARDFDRYRDPQGGGFEASLATCRPIARLLAGAERTRAPLFIKRWQCYFRESAGPGWALVGDAGHFKDPTSGQGISDAFRQSERLAEFICYGIETHTLNEQVGRWWRWRDADAAQMYWWSRDLGRGGVQPPVVVEMLRGIAQDPGSRRALHEVIFRTRPPYRLFSPPRAMAATGRLLLRGGLPRAQVLADARALAAQDLRRRWQTRHPVFESAQPARAGGEVPPAIRDRPKAPPSAASPPGSR